MRKRLVLLGIMAFVTLVGAGITSLVTKDSQTDYHDTLNIVTSFYPMYIATMNIVDGVDGIELVNLTENQGGCLHDYQLTTADMKKLEHADVFIMNGGGMESFIEDILATYPDIQIIDASQGIELLESESEHHHSEDEEEHEEGALFEAEEESEYNAHVWMNPEKYKQQLNNITKGLSDMDPDNEEQYLSQCESYSEDVDHVMDELLALDVSKLKNGIISFHDAFSYLADALSIPVIHSIDLDKDTSLSAGEVAEIIDEVNENNVHYIFTEEQLSGTSPSRVAEETGTTLCIVDSLVSGTMEKDAYLTGMESNIEMLKQVLNNEQ